MGSSRFAPFERGRDLTKGRDAHKAERFGKKYQWIAHHELLARLADNLHPAYESWNPDPMRYPRTDIPSVHLRTVGQGLNLVVSQ